jgi:hypothetical protein
LVHGGTERAGDKAQETARRKRFWWGSLGALERAKRARAETWERVDGRIVLVVVSSKKRYVSDRLFATRRATVGSASDKYLRRTNLASSRAMRDGGNASLSRS